MSALVVCPAILKLIRDNLGAILAVGDWMSRTAVANGQKPMTVKDVLAGMIMAHEIQGVLAIENSYNRVGLEYVDRSSELAH